MHQMRPVLSAICLTAGTPEPHPRWCSGPTSIRSSQPLQDERPPARLAPPSGPPGFRDGYGSRSEVPAPDRVRAEVFAVGRRVGPARGRCATLMDESDKTRRAPGRWRRGLPSCMATRLGRAARYHVRATATGRGSAPPGRQQFEAPRPSAASGPAAALRGHLTAAGARATIRRAGASTLGSSHRVHRDTALRHCKDGGHHRQECKAQLALTASVAISETSQRRSREAEGAGRLAVVPASSPPHISVGATEIPAASDQGGSERRTDMVPETGAAALRIG